ncbi:tetratricopeptide repeat-containing sulfotransferase family protein [Parvularcula sp. IMCC14364]|uniref:tetratricopeptide repeat-containing sulfotransferase family protein n=1 Tax=Parvularcula sp. IMCC14364 TaxID=3067902 RepID=UPI0027414EF2|nr:tetratricopeptide repeat-containing sulfotransferase family protein [Parvularcula sp. IMCC14364]
MSEFSNPLKNATHTSRLDEAEIMLARQRYKEAHTLCMGVLKEDPNAYRAFYLLGILAADHDNHTKACELFDRAQNQASPSASAFAQKARSLIALNRRDAAIDTAAKAASLEPEDAFTLDTLGVVFSRAGLHEKAVTFYEAATRKAPETSTYFYNLGAALQFAGKMEEANTAYRRCLELTPDDARALAAAAQITKQTSEQNDIPALEAMFESASDDADAALKLGHALAKAYEDIGNPAQAMTWLTRAKAGKKRQIAYNTARDAALFTAAKNTATVRHRGHDDASPIFIVGLPRTGTTLVDRILSSHPEIASAGELTDFSLSLKRATGTKSRYVLDTETLEAAGTADLSLVGKDYIAAARKIIPDTRFVIDKMPLNFLCAALIHQALPSARIICLRRHPADSVLSNYRQMFATGFSYYNYSFDLADTAQYYVAFDKLIRHWREQLPATHFTEVSYENIVADIETEARRLINFCSLDWDPACISFHENAAPVATASSAQVRQPLYASSVGRWQRYRDYMQPALEILEGAGLLETS